MSALRLASIALIAGLMTSDGRAQTDTDIAVGKIRNWSHGAQALMIMDFEDSSTLRNIGTIDAEGQIVMEPTVPPPSQQTVSRTFDTCRANTVQIVNGSIGITPIVPLALSGGGNERTLAIADSEEMALWRLNYGRAPMTKGTHLQLVYAEGEAEVTLEAQLGRPLFDRHSRGVRPTAIADDLAASIGSSLDTAESALASARARSSRISGTVHIAAPSDLLGEMITPRLAPLLDAGLDLRLHIGGREALYAMLLEDKVHLAVTASQPEDQRLAFHALGEEHLRAVASPAVAMRIAELPLVEGLNQTAHLAYDLDRPLLRTWLHANQIELTSQPTLTAPDLRVLRSGLCAELGWTVLPGYLTRSERAACTLIEIPAPITVPLNAFYLVWARSSLRHPRVAMARDALIAALRI